ncbi:hypothetical protein [Enterovirga sp. CN4-39]|uniref:hypothetical protein n=1 Tax=Enterovirga sp. CN4-39 TaxID=3400910 RepID=UPI003C0E32FA
MSTVAERMLAAPPLDEKTVYAVKALAKGEASGTDQIKAVEFILHALSGADNQSFVPNDASGGQNTAFLEGRRFVGRELRRIIITPSERLIPKPARTAQRKVTNG